MAKSIRLIIILAFYLSIRSGILAEVNLDPEDASDKLSSRDVTDHPVEISPHMDRSLGSTKKLTKISPKERLDTRKARRGPDGWLKGLAYLVTSFEQAASSIDLRHLNHSTASNETGSRQGNEKNHERRQQSKQERLNVSAVAAEKDNLLSVTRQLVKLARNQFSGPNLWSLTGQSMGRDAGFASSSPFNLLSAASQLAGNSFELFPDASQGHDIGYNHEHGHAMAKSDWFWMVMPALIVFGAGVIIVPLIAAWLVSNAMGQGTLTVSAGRRRRRRDLSGAEKPGDLTLESLQADMFKMLNMHQLLDQAPDLLVNKLSRLQQVLEKYGSAIQ